MFWNVNVSIKSKEFLILEERINSICTAIQKNHKELNNNYSELAVEFHHYREENTTRIRRLDNLLNEKLDIQKESTESLLIGLEKIFSDKINTINNGKPLVTDLLQKVAKLEGVKDAIEHRRSTEEILGSLHVLNEKMLKDDREEKDISIIKEQIRILKWVLGENI